MKITVEDNTMARGTWLGGRFGAPINCSFEGDSVQRGRGLRADIRVSDQLLRGNR